MDDVQNVCDMCEAPARSGEAAPGAAELLELSLGAWKEG